MRRLTRREALVTGGVAVAAGTGLWGRFALGDTFENHLAEQLGLSRELTDELIGAARDHLGFSGFETRASAFTVATTFPGSVVLPRAWRERAVDSLLGPMFVAGFGIGTTGTAPARDQLAGDNFGAVWAGLRPSLVIEPCAGLIDQ